MKRWMQILIGMVAGLVVGLIVGDSILTNEILKPLGDIFIALIRMLVVPLIFCSLITGIVSMDGDLKRMGRIGGMTFFLYLVTTAMAVSIGLVVANVVSPGLGLNLEIPAIGSAEVRETGTLLSNFMATLKSVVPANPMESLSKGSILQIIVFALLFGLAMNKVGSKALPVRAFFESATEIVYALTEMVMKVAPLGVFALMSWVSAKFGVQVLMPLLKLIVAVYVACAIHSVFILGGGAVLFANIPPKRFFKATMEPFSFAFVSTSSAGTLPLTISAVTQKLGVSERISHFVLPLGATINMDGTAIYQGVCAIFVAQIYGIDLNTSHYVTIIFTATLASIGTAGVPGAGLIMLSMVLAGAGLPLEGLMLVGGIDRILDMARTSVNVLGDCMVAAVVGRYEGEIKDKQQA
ncbi:MAG: dicarboxylate/amino acid:cation symporter [Cardiobacteriaceae bacterium]|nr:dicarboxylate/amino acid:cation symporter [Cardiobacteriaceae bacterium]